MTNTTPSSPVDGTIAYDVPTQQSPSDAVATDHPLGPVVDLLDALARIRPRYEAGARVARRMAVSSRADATRELDAYAQSGLDPDGEAVEALLRDCQQCVDDGGVLTPTGVEQLAEDLASRRRTEARRAQRSTPAPDVHGTAADERRRASRDAFQRWGAADDLAGGIETLVARLRRQAAVR